MATQTTTRTALERLMSRVEIDPETGCWNCSYSTDKDGYVQFKVEGKTVRAARWLFQQAVRPLIHGEEHDHLCENRRCVNPCHGEGVSRVENVLRITQKHRRSATVINYTLAIAI